MVLRRHTALQAFSLRNGISDTDSLLHVQLGADFRLGISLRTTQSRLITSVKRPPRRTAALHGRGSYRLTLHGQWGLLVR
jgi:hypothetical protein